nr:zinc finger protein 501-like [Megalopta genalis]
MIPLYASFSAVDPLRITASEKRFCQIKAKSASTCRAKLNGEPTSGKTIVNRSCDNLPCARRSIETIEKTQSNEIQRKTPKAPVKCDHCGEQFRRKSQLAMHMKTYKYDCDYCEKAFRLIRDLRLHCKEKHGAAETRMHRCTGCEYKTSNKASLRDHVTRKHTNNYPHGCPICLKKFKLKTDLRQHTRQVHSDAPAVICPVCGNSYKSNNSLTHHMRSCHNKHPFKCSMCKRCLSTQKILDQHMLWHKERERMVCPICGKTILSSIIDRHMRMHTGVKPHQCPVCAKSFSRQSAMEQHVLIHTGKKPYICDICGQAFTQKPGLICHRKRHEGPLPQLPVMSVKDIVQEFTKKYSTKKTIVNND